MTTRYEVRSGRRTISVQDAHNAQQAVIDFLRSLGCHDDEIVRLSPGTVSWRGAIYRAVPASDEPAGDSSTHPRPSLTAR